MQDALDAFRVDATGTTLTTNVGVPIADDQNSLRAGERGPTLLEDFALIEKIQHFDHERIPERVVHCTGRRCSRISFKSYKSMANGTRRAAFSQRYRMRKRPSSCVSRPSAVRAAQLIPRATSAWIRRQILYERRQLRSRRQQHAGLLHSRCDQISGFHTCRKTRAATAKFRRRPRHTTPYMISCRINTRVDAHDACG